MSGNQLTGPIPPQLADLINLRELSLGGNQLTEELPSGLTDLATLTSLHFQDNEGLCAPPDAAFQAWLADINDVKGHTCLATPTPAAPPEG